MFIESALVHSFGEQPKLDSVQGVPGLQLPRPDMVLDEDLAAVSAPPLFSDVILQDLPHLD